MTRVLGCQGVDTSTQSTKVRITDAATGEQVRFGQAKHPDGTSVNPEFWWEAFTKAASRPAGLTMSRPSRLAASSMAWSFSTSRAT